MANNPNITLPSGQVISGQDPNYSAYVAQGDTKQVQSALPALDQSSAVIQPGAVQNAAITNSVRYTDTVDQLLGRKAFGETEEGRAAAEDVKLKEAKITAAEGGTFTPEEQAAMTAAGKTAEAQYTPLLSDAEIKRKQGLASGLVQAAKSGGLDSSAWVGLSALIGQSAGGAPDWQGTGGRIAALASEYDSIISDLKVKQANALTTAQEAKQQAIISRKKEDWDRAIRLYDIADKAYRSGTDMAAAKIDVLNSYQSHLETQAENAKTEIQNLAQTGVDLNTIDPTYKNQLADMAGISPDVFDAQYNLYRDQYILDIASKLDAGQSYTLSDGTEVKSLKSDSPDLLTSEIKLPDGTIKNVALNKATGKKIWETVVGQEAVKAIEPDLIVSEIKSPDGTIRKVAIDKVTGQKAWETIIGKETPTGAKPAKMTDDFKAWYYKTFKKPVNKDDPDVQAEWERWQATGKGAKKSSTTVDLNNEALDYNSL